MAKEDEELEPTEDRIGNALEKIREQAELTDNLPFTNLDGENVVVTFIAADTITPLSHNLKRIPDGFFVIKTSIAARVYHNDQIDQPWTDQKIFLKSDTVGLRATVFIF